LLLSLLFLLAVPALASDATGGLVAYGDSTAKGVGAKQTWLERLGEARSTAVRNAGVDRQGVEAMAQSATDDAEHRTWIAIFYDRRNAGETPDAWIAAVSAAIAARGTDRFLVMPQVPVSGGREDGITLPVLLEINGRIRATWPENAFDAATEAEFLAILDSDANRSDRIHRNDAGQAIEADFVGRWLTQKGW
jgi:hypothetical protein